MKPITYHEEDLAAWDLALILVQSMKRTEIVEQQERYLRAELRNRLFRCVDDLELVLLPEENRIDLRYASRTGYSHMGVNRRRLEAP